MPYRARSHNFRALLPHFVLLKDLPFPRDVGWRISMRINQTAAYAMYPRNVALPEVVCALNRAGIGNEDICMVLSPAHPDASVFDSEAASSARMIAWFSELGAVFIPTVGFFIRSQAFFPPASTEQSFPNLSRGSKTLLNLGFPQEEAKRLGLQLSDFGALIYIPCSESAKAETAIQVLQNLGAREASTLGVAKATAVAAAA